MMIWKSRFLLNVTLGERARIQLPGLANETFVCHVSVGIEHFEERLVLSVVGNERVRRLLPIDLPQSIQMRVYVVELPVPSPIGDAVAYQLLGNRGRLSMFVLCGFSF